MLSNLLIPIEQVKKGLNLTTDLRDQDVIQYVLSAQSHAEKFCQRNFNGLKTATEYHSGSNSKSLNLCNYPIESIESITLDNSGIFDAQQILSADNYYFESESGIVWRKSGTDFIATVTASLPVFLHQEQGNIGWPVGENNIKVVYKGGYIPETNVVSFAAPNAAHTIADDLSGFTQDDFTLFVKTQGVFSVAGSIVISGNDENGDAITETITPWPDDLTGGQDTFSFSTVKWSEITSVDSSGLTTATGATVSVTALTTPDDLRLAIQLIAMHFYKVDQKNQLNVRNRSIAGSTETVAPDEFPAQARSILMAYRGSLI